MKTSVLILAKLSSIILLGALLVILLTLLEDVFFSNYPGDGSMIAASLLVVVPLANCCFTVHFCNKVLSDEILQASAIKSITFLILAVISFGFSILVSVGVIDSIIDMVREGGVSDFFNRGVGHIILYLSIMAFALLGFINFFLQLYVRKSFIIKGKTSFNQLIDSVGELKK